MARFPGTNKQRTRIFSSGGCGARRPGHQAILVQAAFDRAVVEWRAPGGFQANQLWQPWVATEKISSPPGKALFERVAQARIECRKLCCVRPAHAIGRVGHDHAGWRLGWARDYVE